MSQSGTISQGSVDYPYKWVNDGIHGHIRLDKYLIECIDTEQFQRLRDLKQLGSSYFVFPGASHNRFEHSLGVAHLTGQLIERLHDQQPELEISENEIRCVKIAGLCHDIGHGPFSHIFDSEFIPAAKPNTNWTHEQASGMLLDHMIDVNNIDIDRSDAEFIKSLIVGVPPPSFERKYLYQIVANKTNSVDVDKFDYIARDCQNVGIKSSYDFDRVMNFSRVINNEICYHSKEVYNLYEMFHTRYSLFKRVYTHRVAKSIEFMIRDALLAADSVLNISDAIYDPEHYTYLTDSILRDIQKSKDPALEQSRQLIKDIFQRHLYKFVDEILLSKEMQARITKDHIKAIDIISYQQSQDDLHVDDIIIDWLKINYAMGDTNPVDRIKFFSRFNDFEAYHISSKKVSFVIPEQYQEIIIRIYTRYPEKVGAIQRAFRKWLQFGPLSAMTPNSAVTPNPALTIPIHYESPKKRGSRGNFHSPEPKAFKLDFSTPGSEPY